MENKVKKNMRDSMFTSFFGEEDNFIDLYKECSQRELRLGDAERFILDSDVLKRGLSNDIAFLTKDNALLILMEHQSLPNPNMALRMLIYYVDLLKLWLKLEGKELSQNSNVDAPIPELYVVYNGKKPYGGKGLTLENGFLEVHTKLVDINFSNLKDKNASNRLAGYAFLIAQIETNMAEGMTRNDAFVHAVKRCKEEGYLKGYVERSDFVSTYMELFNYENDLRYEGELIGVEKGVEKGIEVLMKLNKLPREQAEQLFYATLIEDDVS